MKTYGVMGSVAMATVLMLTVGWGDDEPHGTSGNKGGTGGMSSGGTKPSTDGGAAGDGSGLAGSETGGTAAAGGGVGGSSAGGGGTAGSGGSGEPPLTFQSSPAGIELELDAASEAAGLTLTSSSITQETTT